jgi:hypothetical protein
VKSTSGSRFYADLTEARGSGRLELHRTAPHPARLRCSLERESLDANEPPAGLTHAIAGSWWDAKGDWTRAHESAQQDEGVEGSWVHAYLHRKEGDQHNAAYWYRRAGKPVCRESLDAEWLSIVRDLLE